MTIVIFGINKIKSFIALKTKLIKILFFFYFMILWYNFRRIKMYFHHLYTVSYKKKRKN